MGCWPLLLLLVDLGLGLGWGWAKGGHRGWAAAATAAAAAATPEPREAQEPRDADIARDILKGLGLGGRVPDMSKANISQAEWSSMTQLYLERVASRRAEAEAQGVPWDSQPADRRLYTFHGAGSATSPEAPGRSRRSARTRTPRTMLRMDLPADSEVDDAEVRVMVQQPGTLRLFEVWSDGRRLVAERAVAAPGWTQLGALAAARRASALGRPLLLELRCGGGARCADAALNVLAEPAAHVRRRRAVRANCGKDGQRCCRHALDVVFAQIPDMEFIVQPKSFDAGMCRGRCPPRYHPAHHHSLLQGLLRRREQRGPRDQHDKQPRVPRPCCAPERLQPLDVLFVDEDNPTKLKLSEWSEMRVVSCSCA